MVSLKAHRCTTKMGDCVWCILHPRPLSAFLSLALQEKLPRHLRLVADLKHGKARARKLHFRSRMKVKVEVGLRIGRLG